MSSPTQRSLKELRRLDFTAAVVEKWNMHARIRQDFAGFADLIAFKPIWGIVAIQACAASGQSKRVAKVKAEPRAKTWLEAGGKIYVWAWGKRGPRGKRKTWQVNETEIELKDFAEPT